MTRTLPPPDLPEIEPVPRAPAELLPIHAVCLATDGSPRYTMFVPAAELDTDAGRERSRAEQQGGLDAEIRIFLEEQLSDGDLLVDVDAGWGHVGLGAATAPGRRVRVLAAVRDASEQAALERSARLAPCTGTLETARLDDLPTLLASTGAERLFVRASGAAQALPLLDALTALARGGHLAAVAWTSGAPDADFRLREALADEGFSAFHLAAADGDPQLFPLGGGETAGTIFALGEAYCRSLQSPPEPTPPVELSAAHAILAAGEPLAPPLPAPALEVNLSAPVSPKGYGVIGIHLAGELHRIGHRVALFPLGAVGVEGRFRGSVARAIDQQASFSPSAPSVRIARPSDLAQHVGFGPRIGFPLFDLTRFTPRERHHLNALDHLFVVSRWAKAVLEANGIRTPATVVPLGVDRAVFHERIHGDHLVIQGDAKLVHEASLDVGKGDAVRLDIWRDTAESVPARERETVFLNVGGFARHRGQDVLIDAFERAFSPRDRVRLVLACHDDSLGVAGNRAWLERVRRSPLAGRISVVQDAIPVHSRAARLMASADCGVFPARAEGWNRHLLEMMSMGCAVIATAYAGATEFLSAENARLVQIDALEAAEGGADGVEWARLGKRQLENLVEHLREVRRQKESGSLVANRAGIATAQVFSWRNSAQTLAGHLAALSR